MTIKMFYSEISGEFINFVRTSTAISGLCSTNSYKREIRMLPD